MTGYLAIAATIALTVTGQLLLKMGMTSLSPAPAEANVVMKVIHVLLHWQVTVGLGCAVGAAVAWMVALKNVPLSFAYPFMALAIVLVLALSPWVLGEQVPTTGWIGVALVCAGLVVAAQG